MRCIPTLGLTFVAALGTAAMAEEARDPAPHQADAAYLLVERTPSATWLARAALLRQDRLQYLNASVCLEQRGCSTAFSQGRAAARFGEKDFVDALSLGTYGPMNVKFTGDRVKLKVRF